MGWINIKPQNYLGILIWRYPEIYIDDLAAILNIG